MSEHTLTAGSIVDRVPEQFVCFSSLGRLPRLFRKIEHDSYDVLVWSEGKWQFHDNVGEKTAHEWYKDSESQVYVREVCKPTIKDETENSVESRCSVAGVSDLIDALRFYATAQTYHAVTVLVDRPAGEFADDFSDDHGDEYYERAMPGKLARETLTRLGVPW
jgi:hypothetical protein